ncbi:MAG: GNAT family N-acetyltransferase, partial [Clostridia bacterium]|nr:GNAT family N-acetyltransferase [Clostridia bacterium]
WKMSDAEALAHLLNDKRILDNLRDGLPYPYTTADALFFINQYISADKNSNFCYAIVYNDQVAGSIGIFRQGNIHFRTAELGYYIGVEYWGKGIMTEAVRLACKRVFDNTDIVRIYAEPFAENTGSCRVLEKNGFVLEGIMRKNAYKNGNFRDMKLYALVKDNL